MKKCCLMTIWFAVAATAVLAQENSTVPPKLADNSPSLEVTMKFIQDKLNDFGSVVSTDQIHDNAQGNDWSLQYAFHTTNLIANPSACSIGYHQKLEENGTVRSDYRAAFLLKDVANVEVEPLLDRGVVQGHPSWSIKMDPSIFYFESHTQSRKVADRLLRVLRRQLGGPCRPGDGACGRALRWWQLAGTLLRAAAGNTIGEM